MRAKTPGVLILLLLFPPSAHADETHAHNFRYGQRALGMGGAMTAVPGDPEATWYNPACLGFISGTVFSGSIQFFGVEDALVVGALRSPGEPSADATSTIFVPVPSGSVISHEFVAPDADGTGAMVVALSTFVGSASETYFHRSKRTEAMLNGGPATRNRYTSKRQSDRVLYIGPSWSWRPSHPLALGASLFYVRRDQSSNLSGGFVVKQGTDPNSLELRPGRFLDSTTATSVNDGALRAKLGMLYSPTDELRIGLTAFTSALKMHGQGAIVYGLTFSGNDESERPDRQFATKLDTDQGVDAETAYP